MNILIDLILPLITIHILLGFFIGFLCYYTLKKVGIEISIWHIILFWPKYLLNGLGNSLKIKEKLEEIEKKKNPER